MWQRGLADQRDDMKARRKNCSFWKWEWLSPHSLLITRAGSQPGAQLSAHCCSCDRPTAGPGTPELALGSLLLPATCPEGPSPPDPEIQRFSPKAAFSPAPRDPFLPSPGVTLCSSIALTPYTEHPFTTIWDFNPCCLLQIPLSRDFSSSQLA